jgi:hypothetical protein
VQTLVLSRKLLLTSRLPILASGVGAVVWPAPRSKRPRFERPRSDEMGKRARKRRARKKNKANHGKKPNA